MSLAPKRGDVPGSTPHTNTSVHEYSGSAASPSSTIDHHHTIVFNVWVVIVTAVVFFIILSWYNALLSVYNYAIGYNPNEVCDYNRRNRETMMATIG